MIGLALAQVLMSFNVSALPVSLGGMVDEFGTPPTTVSTAIVAYGLVVAALVMVGAKLGQRIGWVLRTGSSAQFHGAAVHPDRPRPQRIRYLVGDDAIQYHRIRHCAGRCPLLQPLHPESDRPILLRPHHRRARMAEGALVTLVFNVLVTAVPKDLAGYVGSLRGTAQNLASAVGTALAGALLVTLLSIGVGQAVASHVELPEYLVAQVDLDNVNFVSNERLEEILEATTATDTQVDAAVQINIDARLDALRIGLLTLAALSAIAWIPASRLPNYRKQEIPDPVNENG